MIARLIVAGQETWHYTVTGVSCDGRYLRLSLLTYPYAVSYWLRTTRVLLAASGEDVTALLREEQA